jgi:hypothetical protein
MCQKEDKQKTTMSTVSVRFGSGAMAYKDIQDLVADAKRYRRPGVTDGLQPLESVPSVNLDPNVIQCPTLFPVFNDQTRVARGSMTRRAAHVEEFRTRLEDADFRLAEFTWHEHGMLLAGGSVAAIMMFVDRERREESYDDFDVFLVGHATKESCEDAILALGRHLGYPGGVKVTVTRNANTITFHRARDGFHQLKKVQVILRQYATAAEVLHGFDNGASSVGYDGTQVWLTGLGAFAAARAANILCLDGRRGSYEHRLVKYMRRGYSLLLPNLNLQAYWNLREGHRRAALPFLNTTVVMKPEPDFMTKYAFHVLVVTDVQAVMGRPAPIGFTFATYESTPGSACTAQENLAALLKKDVSVQALTIFTPWDFADETAQRAALFGGSVTIPRDVLDAAYESMYQKAIFRPKLRFATNLLSVAMEDEFKEALEEAISPEVVRALVETKFHRLRLRLEAGVTIPFELRGVDDGTLLTAEYDHHGMSLLTWYGETLFKA